MVHEKDYTRMRFLTKYECKLDYASATIIIDNMELEMTQEPNGLSKNDPDRIISQKVTVYSANIPDVSNKTALMFFLNF